MELLPQNNSKKSQEGGVLRNIAEKGKNWKNAMFVASSLSGASMAEEAIAKDASVVKQEQVLAQEALHSSRSQWSVDKLERAQKYLQDAGDANQADLYIQDSIEEWIRSYNLWEDDPNYTTEDLRAIENDAGKVKKILEGLFEKYGSELSEKYHKHLVRLDRAMVNLENAAKQKEKPRFNSPQEENETTERILKHYGYKP